VSDWLRNTADLGRLYFAVQWTMVAVGSAIGAFIAFGYNFHQTEATGTPVAVSRGSERPVFQKH
jgi:hypothetical protein